MCVTPAAARHHAEAPVMAVFTCWLLALLPLAAAELNGSLPWCQEGRVRLESSAFLACRQQLRPRLHSLGIWITRSHKPGWQKPAGALSVCEYLESLQSTCLSLYTHCTPGRERLVQLWARQAVAETEIYGGPGEILECPGVQTLLGEEEVATGQAMVQVAYWRQDSGNCRYLMHYHSTPLPLTLYNHNLDKILRCDGKCDPEGSLPHPFPLFQEEDAHINSQMNQTIVAYSQCLADVGLNSSDPVLRTNLTQATWQNSNDVKWSTCASLKTFVRNCSLALLTCLEEDTAEVVLAQDFTRMVDLVKEGIEQNVKKQEVFPDFDHTRCDIFGGDVSEGLRLQGGGQGLVLVMYTLLIIHWKVFK